MGQHSKIEWTDSTFNPWIGCSKVSPACKNCYAERDMDLRYGRVKWGPSGNRMVTSDANWRKPLQWNREAKKNGQQQFVFCASLADVFEEWNGPVVDAKGQVLNQTLDDLRLRLFELINATPWLTWLLLTKRPERINEWQSKIGDNIWLGTTVEDQQRAEARMPHLIASGGNAGRLFVSCEPLLGELNLRPWLLYDVIDWVICGGESGSGARPTKVDWARSLRDQCIKHGVSFFFKQWGEHDQSGQLVGKVNAGTLLDGEFWLQRPEPLESEGQYGIR